MLKFLRTYREKGFPEEMVNNLAKYMAEYKRIPVMQRFYIDFDYFMRCKHVEYIRKYGQH